MALIIMKAVTVGRNDHNFPFLEPRPKHVSAPLFWLRIDADALQLGRLLYLFLLLIYELSTAPFDNFPGPFMLPAPHRKFLSSSAQVCS